MIVHIAAPHSNWFQDAMKIYLAGSFTRPYVFEQDKDDDMNPRDAGALSRRLHVLESFYYIQDWMSPYIDNKVWSFMLDSGAFTFLQQEPVGVDWHEYVDRYAAFINDHDIQMFFELDIDPIVGHTTVVKYRERLEAKTGRRSIPVWHRSRGKQVWLDLCDEYEYVAVGGIVGKEIKKDEYSIFHWLIREAHARGAKVHGLGFTNLKLLPRFKWDSVDSTAWIYGNRSGFIQTFNGETLVKNAAPAGMKMKSRETAVHNFNEWVKFQRYAERHL